MTSQTILCYHSGDTQQLKVVSANGNYGNKQMFIKNFNIIPQEVKADNKIIFPLGDTRTIKISSTPQIFLSPISKLPRLSSTPKKSRSSTKLFHEQREHEIMDVDECDLRACFGELSVEEEDMKAVMTDGVQIE